MLNPFTGVTSHSGITFVEVEPGTVIERDGKRETVTETNIVMDRWKAHCTKATLAKLRAEIDKRWGK